MNIVDQIFSKADPASHALIDSAGVITYGMLNSHVDSVADRLDCIPARRVALDCPDGAEHIILALAILKSGRCMIPLARELSEKEKAEVLRLTHCQAVMQSGERISMLQKDSPPVFDEEVFDALQPAFVRFSSGTTGESKGVVLSHHTLLERVTAANRGLQIGPDDKVLWILPMAHHFAVSIVLYLLHGATVLLPANTLADAVLTLAETHCATVLYAAPFHYGLLAADQSSRRIPHLRLAVSTATALSEDISQAFGGRFGVYPSQGYGIIEVGLPCLNVDAAQNKPLSVGRSQPDFQIRLDGGEIWIKGPGIFDAYLHPWKTRNEVLAEGWFKTGDMGHLDDEGYLYLSGRSNSVINVGGLKCFPEEIESVLLRHPEVRAARVFGQAQSRAGMVPVAEIVVQNASSPPSLTELIAHCRDALAAYKVPVDFLFVDDIPKTASGKIKRVLENTVR